MIRKIRIAKNNPNFSLNDDSRVLFYDKEYATKNNKSVSETIEITKNAWIGDTFDVEIEIKSFNQPSSRLNAEVKVAVNDNTIEKYMNVRYLMLNNYKNTGELINSEFYFVNKNRIANANVVSLSLRLDSVTTYFDKLSFGKSTKIERRHFDRWKIEGDKIVANNDEDSGIWNDESDIQNNTFINKKNLPINVFSKYDETIVKDRFYSVALMKVRSYSNNVAEIDFLSYLDIKNRIPFNIGIWPINLKFNRLNADGSTYSKVPGITEYQLNKHYSAYIERIFSSPLPFVPKKFFNDDNEIKSVLWNQQMGVEGATHVDVIPLSGTDTNTEHIIFPADVSSNSINAAVHTQHDNVEYEKDIDIKELLNNEISIANLTEDYDYEREIKLQTTKHKRILIKSVNGQKTQVINEFLLNDRNIKIKIGIAVSMEGVFQIVKIVDNPYYDEFNKSNNKTLIISYKDQVPNASTPYNDFMATQGNQYKTAISNNRIKSATSAVGGILGGVVGGLTGNFIGGAASIMGAGNSVLSGYLKERQFQAQAKDLTNMGSTTEVTDTSLIKDVALVDGSFYGDTKLAITVEEHPTIHKVEISNLYNKIGYSANLTEKVEDYAWFSKRSRFTFIQAPLISDSVEKVNIGEEIIEDINSVFNNGVRLWNVNAQGKVDINNYGKENWEHAIKTKIDEVKVPRI